jgi:hypothetical protein
MHSNCEWAPRRDRVRSHKSDGQAVHSRAFSVSSGRCQPQNLSAVLACRLSPGNTQNLSPLKQSNLAAFVKLGGRRTAANRDERRS